MTSAVRSTWGKSGIRILPAARTRQSIRLMGPMTIASAMHRRRYPQALKSRNLTRTNRACTLTGLHSTTLRTGEGIGGPLCDHAHNRLRGIARKVGAWFLTNGVGQQGIVRTPRQRTRPTRPGPRVSMPMRAMGPHAAKVDPRTALARARSGPMTNTVATTTGQAIVDPTAGGEHMPTRRGTPRP